MFIFVNDIALNSTFGFHHLRMPVSIRFSTNQSKAPSLYLTNLRLPAREPSLPATAQKSSTKVRIPSIRRARCRNLPTFAPTSNSSRKVPNRTQRASSKSSTASEAANSDLTFGAEIHRMKKYAIRKISSSAAKNAMRRAVKSPTSGARKSCLKVP